MAVPRDNTAGVIESYPPILANHLFAKHQWIMESLPHLRGKNLSCWCALPADGEPNLCHAAVLMELANSAPDTKRDALSGEGETANL